MNLRAGTVIGVEALIRWQHPEKGLLPPGRFLPDIEGHEVSVALGEWVLETALRQIETWADAGLDLSVCERVGVPAAAARLFSQAESPNAQSPQGATPPPGAGSA